MTYTGLQGRVYRMLQQVSWARERRFKDKALAKLLTSHKPWDGENSVFKVEEIAEILGNYNTADRYWRLILEHHPELRGADWSDKTVLSQRKVLSLEYEPGHHQRSKVLEEIVS